MGGAEKLLVDFARHADRGRFDLHFVSLGTRGVLAQDIEACGWPVTALDQPTGVRPALLWRLFRLLGRLRADVVHTHDERPHLYGTLAGRLARVKQVIHTRHHGLNIRLSRRQIWLVKAMAGWIDRYVCVSRDSARVAAAQGIPHRKVEVIHNGIDLERFPDAGPRPRGPIVAVARLSPEKSLDTLVRATALAVQEDRDITVEIAGDGPCRGELAALAEQLGLTVRQLRFLGQVKEIPQLLARSDVFVLPSLSEGISLTLLEAMASGMAVAATQVGGNPEVVADGATGLLVPAGDPPALAAALLRLRRQRDLNRRLGRAGRARVERLFDIRRMVADYEALYQGMRRSSRTDG